MNGCSYEQRSFTLPAGSTAISQMKWDLAFLTRTEFIKKYGVSDWKYDDVAKEIAKGN